MWWIPGPVVQFLNAILSIQSLLICLHMCLPELQGGEKAREENIYPSIPQTCPQPTNITLPHPLTFKRTRLAQPKLPTLLPHHPGPSYPPIPQTCAQPTTSWQPFNFQTDCLAAECSVPPTPSLNQNTTHHSRPSYPHPPISPTCAQPTTP